MMQCDSLSSFSSLEDSDAYSRLDSEAVRFDPFLCVKMTQIACTACSNYGKMKMTTALTSVNNLPSISPPFSEMRVKTRPSQE